MTEALRDILGTAQRILIIQADNPDADSLGSALALEEILGEQGKSTYLYCGIDTPTYLRYLEGWSRVSNEVPKDFDASIIVDASALSLLQKLQESPKYSSLKTKPCIVLDHHAETDNDIAFAELVLNKPELSSTGELIYEMAKELGWNVNTIAAEAIATAILGDTQGLTNESATANTYRVIADLIDKGLDRPKLEELRRSFSKMDRRIFTYKSTLIARTEFAAEGKIAHVTIPQDEINTFSPLYNPAALIQPDMLQTSGVAIAIVFKSYADGKILASIRSNQDGPIAGELASHMGGGGHLHAAGFKVIDGKPFNEVKSECLRFATELLNNIDTKDENDETIQYTYSTN